MIHRDALDRCELPGVTHVSADLLLPCHTCRRQRVLMGTGANAQAATATPPTVPDALAAELLTGLGESAFVELTALVALENFPPVLSDGDAVLNGATGVVRSAAGTPVMAGTAEFDGERVARILVFRNPERLAGLRRL